MVVIDSCVLVPSATVPDQAHLGPVVSLGLEERWSISCVVCGLDSENPGAPDARTMAKSARWWRCPACDGREAGLIRTLVPTPMPVGAP